MIRPAGNPGRLKSIDSIAGQLGQKQQLVHLVNNEIW